MSSVDDLIGELFPGSKTAESNVQTSDAAREKKNQKQSSWDVDNDDESGQHAPSASQRKSPAGGAGAKPTAQPAKRASATHHFDSDSDEEANRRQRQGDRAGSSGNSRPTHGFDDDEDDHDPNNKKKGAANAGACGPKSASHASHNKHSTLYTVPFPNQSALAGLPTCTSKCFVTNKGDGHKAPPSVEELRRITHGQYDATSTQPQMMIRKAAYYVGNPRVGNSCLDGGANVPTNVAGGGGCPNMVCRKCNYGVIRLQGAAWADGNGAVDLYLTVRNYYPDWSRLASSFPVGLCEEEQQKRGLVLTSCPSSAAYCCQCSWLTVSCERAVIETKLSDTASYVSESNLFATKLPSVPGEKRRPPLWACKGHYLL